MAENRRKKNGGMETVRIQFSLPASLVREIDEYCERTHMLRSTFVEYTLASTLNSTKQLVSALPDVMVSKMVETAGE